MTIKRLFMILFVLLIGSGAFLFLRSSHVLPLGDKLKSRSAGAPASVLDKASRVALHSLAADWETVAAVEKQPVLSWEDWVKRGVEVSLAEDVLYGYINTPAELEDERAKKLVPRAQWAADCKAQGCILPDSLFGLPKLPPEKLFDYEGPQTGKALIAEYDQDWINRYPQSVDWDVHYPKAAWIDRIVSMGGKFQEIRDYSFYLKLRRNLIRDSEKPEKWHSGAFGIPPTTSFEEYESAYIQRKIWENQMRKKVRAAHPNEPRITTFFPSSHPDKYLPVVGNMTYVYRRPNSSGMRTYGTMLTPEQSSNLKRKGIEPEGIEIIYIDDEYNVLTEKPKPYNHQEWLEKNSYDIVPEGLRARDGTIVSPERYQEIKGVPMPAETLARYQASMGVAAPVVNPDAEVARAMAEREAAAAREVAKVEFDRFQDSMRQQEAFQSMASGEVARALARQYSQQYLSKHTLKPGSAQRMETALEVLFQHGFEEGFRRLRGTDSAMADELERQLAETHRPPVPQLRQQNKVPQKPSETPPSQPDAP